MLLLCIIRSFGLSSLQTGQGKPFTAIFSVNQADAPIRMAKPLVYNCRAQNRLATRVIMMEMVFHAEMYPVHFCVKRGSHDGEIFQGYLLSRGALSGTTAGYRFCGKAPVGCFGCNELKGASRNSRRVNT
jgi:hypothetical protein